MAATSVEIAGRTVGEGFRPFVVGEVAQAHDGSLGLAHAFIDAIADAGADAVKFQTHIAEAESTPSEPWRVRFSRQDNTRFDYWKRMEFSESQWVGLADHARARQLVFLSSPFSSEAFELLHRLGVPAWKLASGEVTNLPLLQQMANTRLPVLLSSGMSTFADLDRAVSVCRESRAPFGVFQCTTLYPCPPEKIGLNLMTDYRERYACPVGLSDHSGRVFAGLAAAALGASMIEVHVTFDRQMFGPDVPASLTFGELRQLVQGVGDIHRMRSSPLAKDDLAGELASVSSIFQKNLVARRDLPAGTILEENHLALKKAGGGLPPASLPHLLGRRLARPVTADVAISEADLEPVGG